MVRPSDLWSRWPYPQLPQFDPVTRGLNLTRDPVVNRWLLSDLKSSNGSVSVKSDPVVLSFGFVFSAIATNLGKRSNRSGSTGGYVDPLPRGLSRWLDPQTWPVTLCDRADSTPWSMVRLDPVVLSLGKLGAFSDGLTRGFEGLTLGVSVRLAKTYNPLYIR